MLLSLDLVFKFDIHSFMLACYGFLLFFIRFYLVYIQLEGLWEKNRCFLCKKLKIILKKLKNESNFAKI